ncbi:MAG: hypothetical protein ACREU5_04525 [Burkholderiales bacterium]
MNQTIEFRLPTGESASVSREQARALADKLWNLGTVPGAPTAAARIADALRAHWLYGGRVEFEEREVAALTLAADATIEWKRAPNAAGRAVTKPATSNEFGHGDDDSVSR